MQSAVQRNAAIMLTAMSAKKKPPAKTQSSLLSFVKRTPNAKKDGESTPSSELSATKTTPTVAKKAAVEDGHKATPASSSNKRTGLNAHV